MTTAAPSFDWLLSSLVLATIYDSMGFYLLIIQQVFIEYLLCARCTEVMMLCRADIVPAYYLVGGADELIEHCNKLDGDSNVLEKFPRGKFYPGLEATEGFLEEVTSELYLNRALAQARYRKVRSVEEKRHRASNPGECKGPHILLN